MTVPKDNGEEKARLEWSAREWAGLVYALTSMIDSLAEDALQQVRGEGLDVDWEDRNHVRKAVQRFTHDTIRLKEIVTSTSQRYIWSYDIWWNLFEIKDSC